MKKEIMDNIAKEIDKLCNLYSIKIYNNKISLKSLLIEFTEEYNKIWNDYYNKK